MEPLTLRPAVRPTTSPAPLPPLPRSSNALNIVDDFQPGFGTDPGLMPPPHGVKVELAARDTGYQGAINRIQTGSNPLLENQRMAEMALLLNPSDRNQARTNLDAYVQNHSMAVMLGAGVELNRQTQDGTTQAVTNFSLGSGPSVATANLYNRARLAWTPPGPNEAPADHPDRAVAPQLMRNLATALDVKPEDLTSANPAVSGPARTQFQQRLVDFTTQSGNSQTVQRFHQGYAETVRKYEALGNSVVVSAGNEGELLQQMQADNGGNAIKAPAGFLYRPLTTPETTSVGAMGFTADMRPRVAPFSTGGSNVPVIAYGRAVDGQPGTSFAAPRVGAVMQQIHRQNPGMSSAEVERQMLRMHTTPVEGTRALTL